MTLHDIEDGRYVTLPICMLKRRDMRVSAEAGKGKRGPKFRLRAV